MFDFKSLQSAKKNLVQKSVESSDNFDIELKNAIDSFLYIIAEIEYQEKFDEKKLKSVSNKFLDLFEKRKNIPELYYFLSLVFCMFDKPDLAKDYYSTGLEKFPDHELFKNNDSIKSLLMGG